MRFNLLRSTFFFFDDWGNLRKISENFEYHLGAVRLRLLVYVVNELLDR